MRLLHVIAHLDPRHGGAASVASGMCQALVERGHDVSMYALQEGGKHEDTVGALAYDVRLFPVDFHRMGVSASMIRALSALDGFDLVHIHQLFRLPQNAAAYFARRRHIPYVIQPHGGLIPVNFCKPARRLTRRAYFEMVERPLIASAEAIVYTNEAECDAAGFLRLSAPPAFVSCGISMSGLAKRGDGRAFRARFGLENCEVILWMGRLAWQKGLDFLIPAAAAVLRDRPSARLVLAGADQEGLRSSLDQMIASENVADRVTFTGFLDDEEKAGAYRAADLFVLPSRFENFGVVLAEAMAYGCPVVVSDQVMIWKEIVEAKAGLVARLDVGELAKAIAAPLCDPALRQSMGAAAKNLASSFDWSSIGEKLESTYKSIIKAKRRQQIIRENSV